MIAYKHQQARRRRPSLSDVPLAAPSVNLVKRVVAVAAVLGSETAEVLTTRNCIARGMRGSRPAKHGFAPRLTRRRVLINTQSTAFITVPRYHFLIYHSRENVYIHFSQRVNTNFRQNSTNYYCQSPQSIHQTARQPPCQAKHPQRMVLA